MAAKRKTAFDTVAFLTKAGTGRTISKFRKGTTNFAQGDAADAVFYIKKGKVKITVISAQGKEAIIADLSLVSSAASA